MRRVGCSLQGSCSLFSRRHSHPCLHLLLHVPVEAPVTLRSCRANPRSADAQHSTGQQSTGQGER